jgi:hypothetical protein
MTDIMEAIMKKASFIIGAIAMVAAALLFTGCIQATTTSVTVDQQMTNFKGYVEAGTLDSLKSCCLSTASKYSEADAAFWETYFGGSKTLTYSVSGTTASVTYNTIAFTFTLKEETSGVYKIATVTRDSDATVIFN